MTPRNRQGGIALVIVLWFSVLLALFVIFTHRSNIANMINGTEYRFERIRIRNWFR